MSRPYTTSSSRHATRRYGNGGDGGEAAQQDGVEPENHAGLERQGEYTDGTDKEPIEEVNGEEGDWEGSNRRVSQFLSTDSRDR